MNRAYLQGTPWHHEQIKRSCEYGSQYCLYNKNICTCRSSHYYHTKCKGKGLCEDFESKGTTARVISKNKAFKSKPIKINNFLKNVGEDMNMLENDIIDIEDCENGIPNETPDEKFKRLSKTRIKYVVEDLRKISNLANKNNYFYTEDEVNKIFEYLERALSKTKQSFTQEDFMEEFKW